MVSDIHIVKTALEDLLKNYSTLGDMSNIDEVVINYVCGVINDIVSGDEEIDAMEMKDVMNDYIPQFEEIPVEEVESWVASVVKEMLQERNKAKINREIKLDEIVSNFTVPLRKHALSDSSNSYSDTSSERSQKLSESSDDCTKYNEYESEAFIKLMELFPKTCTLEAEHCLRTCDGDLEKATALISEREEQGIAFKPSPSSKIIPKSNKQKVVDDKDIRNIIFSRYGFVDHDVDNREHRPMAPKWEGKKMVRYRDNKIVSIKGEKFTEVKKEESDDMKRTYVNLKPGKQYRFH